MHVLERDEKLTSVFGLVAHASIRHAVSSFPSVKATVCHQADSSSKGVINEVTQQFFSSLYSALQNICCH